MTREQERINAACEYAGIYSLNPLSKSLAHPHFLEGAQWADKTMIDKACEWFIRGGYFVNSNETIEDFRKAMEE